MVTCAILARSTFELPAILAERCKNCTQELHILTRSHIYCYIRKAVEELIETGYDAEHDHRPEPEVLVSDRTLRIQDGGGDGCVPGLALRLRFHLEANDSETHQRSVIWQDSFVEIMKHFDSPLIDVAFVAADSLQVSFCCRVSPMTPERRPRRHRPVLASSVSWINKVITTMAIRPLDDPT